MEHPLKESSWRRARDDTVLAFHTIRLWVVFVAWEGVLMFVPSLMTPVSISRWEFAGIQAGMFFGGMLMLLGAVFLVSLLFAPYRQRDEARGLLKQLETSGKTISHFVSLVREADKFSIISVRENSESVAIDTAIQEAVKWTIKAISEVEVKLGPVRGQQLRMEAELPSEGDIKDADFDVQYPHSTFESRLGLIRDRHYNVRNWIRSYITDA